MDLLELISVAFGWIYFFLWSASFYPQPLLNFHRKSTSGSTVDFPAINCLGFLAYFVSNALFYSSSLVRQQYAARHHGLTPTVRFNDLAFAGHALLLSSITTSQYWPSLWGFSPSPGTRPSRFILGVAFGCLTGVVATALVVMASNDGQKVDPQTAWCALDIVYAISYVKLVITLIKYAPQIVFNYRNRSTKGWSVWQILFDFGGGILSIAQQSIDSYLQRDWSGITGNPVKFALGNVSMMYDLVFMTQHYVLYADARTGKPGERETLLESGSGDRRLD